MKGVMMRFSIYLNPQTRGPEEDASIIETTIEQAVRATTAGVQGVALTEHHFSGYNTYGNNFMLASHLCALTPRETTFLMAVAVPTLHNPMRLAQSATLLDILTRGNVIVGFAAGGSPVEYAGLGRDPSVRHEQMFHNLEVMERAREGRQRSGLRVGNSLRARLAAHPHHARPVSTDRYPVRAGHSE
jgi:alkanesulfonate monooxygenase SsuD/methylene tetrahydromethanopterin reductase-like flavin-dependent oxidoreductase (luciferase family)